MKIFELFICQAEDLAFFWLGYYKANITNDKLAETFTPEDRVDLSNFFKGFMGEYFFRDIVLKMNREGLIVKNNKNGTNVLLNYYDVAPLSIKDFGIDGTCVQKSYSVEDWANDDDGLIERTKDLMINREPKLEEVFKKFDDFVVEK